MRKLEILKSMWLSHLNSLIETKDIVLAKSDVGYRIHIYRQMGRITKVSNDIEKILINYSEDEAKTASVESVAKHIEAFVYDTEILPLFQEPVNVNMRTYSREILAYYGKAIEAKNDKSLIMGGEIRPYNSEFLVYIFCLIAPLENYFEKNDFTMEEKAIAIKYLRLERMYSQVIEYRELDNNTNASAETEEILSSFKMRDNFLRNEWLGLRVAEMHIANVAKEILKIRVFESNSNFSKDFINNLYVQLKNTAEQIIQQTNSGECRNVWKMALLKRNISRCVVLTENMEKEKLKKINLHDISINNLVFGEQLITSFKNVNTFNVSKQINDFEVFITNKITGNHNKSILNKFTSWISN